MNKPIEKLIEGGSNQLVPKKGNRCRSFYFRYLELCRSKNMPPINDIKNKGNPTVCDLLAEKISVNDWMLIVEALHYDQILQTLSIRTRRSGGVVLDSLDTERKAKIFKQKASIYTKFVFSGVMEAISHCISMNKNLKVLHLEGLPLTDIYVDTIAKSMATSEGLRDVSFARSNIQDEGCETICSTIKYLENVEKVNLTDCHLTTRGAECVADMIKMQKISRYTEGWQKSLRYQDVDPNSIPGLREIYLSHNPAIGDDGVKAICEVLKEDVWIKVIEMEECGLSDLGANCVIDCLTYNNFITEFNVNNNPDINKFILRNIHDQLGKEDAEQRAIDEHQQYLNGVTGLTTGNKKISVSQLRDRLKYLEDQLEYERVLRKKAETLNERLNQQILAYETQIEDALNSKIPQGFVVVRNDALQEIIKERNDLQDLVHNAQLDSLENAHLNSYRSNPSEASVAQTLRTLPFVKLYETSPEESGDEHNVPKRQGNTARLRKIKSEMVQLEVVTPKVVKEVHDARSDNEFLNDGQNSNISHVNDMATYEKIIGDHLESINAYPPSFRKSAKSKSDKTSILMPVEEYPEEAYDDSGPRTSLSHTEDYDGETTECGEATENTSDNEWPEMDTDRTKSSGTMESGCRSPETNNPALKVGMHPMKVILNPKQDKLEIGQGDGGIIVMEKELNDNVGNKSPRSLFFGLTNEA